MSNAQHPSTTVPLPALDFRSAPERLTLKREEVHIWRVGLDQHPQTVARLSAVLADDERNRADKLYFEKDRRRFTVARGVLRIILGRYLNTKPEQLGFHYTKFGKPMLANAGVDALRFNVSHSEELAVYAVACGREVGIDIEYLRPDIEAEQIAQQFFSSTEAAMLRSLPGEVRTRAFFNCWTRKEAYIKARGDGLSF